MKHRVRRDWPIRSMLGKRVSKLMTGDLLEDLEHRLYNALYRDVAARVAYEVLEHVKTGDEEGPFI